MRHIIFFTAVFLLIIVVLTHLPARSEAGPERAYFLTGEVTSDLGGVACCSFVQEDESRTCAALPGRTCDLCNTVCAELGQ